jgi:hypothetical protein
MAGMVVEKERGYSEIVRAQGCRVTHALLIFFSLYSLGTGAL